MPRRQHSAVRHVTTARKLLAVMIFQLARDVTRVQPGGFEAMGIFSQPPAENPC